jgi:Mrp family chromosome partitioning ATPase
MPHVVASSSERAEWLAARALLATRRLRPLVPVALAAFAVVFAAVYAARGPLARRAARVEQAMVREQVRAVDTLRLLADVEHARARLVQYDSALREQQREADSSTATSSLSASAARQRDSLQTMLAQLDALIERAAKAPLTASYRALASSPALRELGTVHLLMDTLDLLERARRSLDPAAAPQSEFARLSQRANSIGAELQAIGLAKKVSLLRRIDAIETPTVDHGPDTLAVDSTRILALRDSAVQRLAEAESALGDARTQYRVAREQADSVAQWRASRILGASPFAAALSALLMAVVLVFTLAVVGEARHPTVAHAREAERLTGLPVLASAKAFRIPKAGRARLQPGTGVEPFRMLFLSLTASGTRHRVVAVTGDDAVVTAAAAGRLAVCAAADEHATLVVDLAPGRPSTAAYFGWRDEPGFTEAIAGVRLWREVARPIGASEGLVMDVIPAGMQRSDTVASVAHASSRRDFSEFLAEYDIAVLVAPTMGSLESVAAVEVPPPIVVVVRVAKTRLQALKAMLLDLKKRKAMILGLVIIRQ